MRSSGLKKSLKLDCIDQKVNVETSEARQNGNMADDKGNVLCF